MVSEPLGVPMRFVGGLYAALVLDLSDMDAREAQGISIGH